MKFDELSRAQLIELKQRILYDRNVAGGMETSWGELVNADALVSDAEAREKYGESVFSRFRFCCTGGGI